MPTNLAQPLIGPFRVGARGDGVRAIQQRLNEVFEGSRGFVPLAVDGAFGGRSAKAVIAFQQERRLRPDGVVGPITARALGFTGYTSMQRIGAGAVELASSIGGALARLVPAPHTEPDPAYDILLAIAVQADAMRTVLRALPAAAATKHEVERIVASLHRQLENMRHATFLAGPIQGMADAMQTQRRLAALASQLHAIARRQSGPANQAQGTVLETLSMMSEALASMASVVSAYEVVAFSRQVQLANQALQIAARIARKAQQFVPAT